MKLSLSDAATVMGRSERQLRYLIQQQRLPAVKAGGRWVIDSSDLPLTVEQRRDLGNRVEAAREAFESALVPVEKAADTPESKRRYSVTDLAAFQIGEPIWRELRGELGAEDPSCLQLRQALGLVAQGCHSFHPAEKAKRFTEARELVAATVAELLLGGEGGDPARRRLADRLEQELIPRIAGLVSLHEKRGKRSRFERFGSFRSAQA